MKYLVYFHTLTAAQRFISQRPEHLYPVAIAPAESAGSTQESPVWGIRLLATCWPDKWLFDDGSFGRIGGHPREYLPPNTFRIHARGHWNWPLRPKAAQDGSPAPPKRLWTLLGAFKAKIARVVGNRSV